MASIDIVNCKSCQVQINGTIPTAVIDKTDGLNLFLSKDCLNIEVYTAKSSELNISIPNKDGEFDEKPVPEQMCTKIKDGLLHTSIVEFKG
jgi:adenylyl cyclase-associated protein